MKPNYSRKPNYLYAIVSVALVLFLLGIFGLVVVQGRQLIRHFKEQIEVIVELKDGSSPTDRRILENRLASWHQVLPNSTRFVSKEAGAAMMQEEFGEEFMRLDMPNPLYDVLAFRVKAEFLSMDSLTVLRQQLREIPFVSDVYYQEDVTETISRNLGNIAFGVLVLGVIFILVAVALILNTIRLALYANRIVIKNMELVGASWATISRPYLRRSLWHGLLSSLLALVSLTLLGYFILRGSPDLADILHRPGILVVFGALLGLGIVVSFLSTYYVVQKYLKMRVDDLY